MDGWQALELGTHGLMAPAGFSAGGGAGGPPHDAGTATELHLAHYFGALARTHRPCTAGCGGWLRGSQRPQRGLGADEHGKDHSADVGPWATLLMQVFAIDVMECPKCASRMQRSAVIMRPDVIRAILSCARGKAPPEVEAGLFFRHDSQERRCAIWHRPCPRPTRVCTRTPRDACLGHASARMEEVRGSWDHDLPLTSAGNIPRGFLGSVATVAQFNSGPLISLSTGLTKRYCDIFMEFVWAISYLA